MQIPRLARWRAFTGDIGLSPFPIFTRIRGPTGMETQAERES
jgi:hypothetical protein